MKNLMIDLETLSTRSDACIVSIGAVFFDREGLGIGQKFYQEVNLKSCRDQGLHFCPDTISWWMNQSEESREVFKSSRGKLALSDALKQFLAFVSGNSDGVHSDILLWGNGSDFDLVIMSNALRVCGLPSWPFWNNRCYRTYKSLYPNVRHKRVGVYHNALDDAIFQAEHMLKIDKFVYDQAKDALNRFGPAS